MELPEFIKQFADRREPIQFVLAGGLLIIALYAARHSLRSSRKVHRALDTPTVPTGRLIVGTLEVFGGAQTSPWRDPIESPFDGTPCAWWSAHIEELEKRDKTQVWQVRDTVSSSAWIGVDDGSGLAIVNMAGSRIGRVREETFVPSQIPKTLSGADLRAIAAGGDRASTPPAARSGVIGFLTTLFEGYTPNRPIRDLNGRWRVVEQSIPINQEIYVRGRSDFDSDLHVAVIHQTDSEPLTVYRGSEGRFTRNQRILNAFATVVLFAALGGIGFALEELRLSIFGAGIALACVVIVQGIRIRNRIVATGEQVQSGRQLIDIAEQKRSSLVPSLQAVVAASAQHETAMLSLLASDSGVETRQVLLERYPQLSSNANFLALQDELILIEDDLAIARGFHADAIAIANTRRQSFPDRYFIPALTD